MKIWTSHHHTPQIIVFVWWKILWYISRKRPTLSKKFRGVKAWFIRNWFTIQSNQIHNPQNLIHTNFPTKSQPLSLTSTKQPHHPSSDPHQSSQKMATAFATSSSVVGLGTSSLSSPSSRTPRLVSGNPPLPPINPSPTFCCTSVIDFGHFSCLPRVRQVTARRQESSRCGTCIRRKIHLVCD